jgi:hypothetical protein
MVAREFVVRFAVVREGQIVSSIWRVWKGRNNDNIYLAPRNVAGSIKVSMHANRYCHVAVTQQQWNLTNGDIAKRPTLVSWVRPDARAEGWVVGASFLFVPELLFPVHKGMSVVDADTYLIEAPTPGRAIIVDLIFSRLPPGTLRLEPGIAGELGQTKLQSGEYFAVIGSLIDFDYEEFFRKANLTTPLDRVVTIGDVDRAGTRMALFGDPAVDNHLRILDVGVGLISRN